jgi:hypothetical protein
MDAGFFALSSSLPTDRDQFFASGAGDVRDVAGVVYEGGQYVGRVVYRAGRTSGWDAGTIAFRNQSVNIGSLTNPCLVHGTFGIELKSADGDSGGGIIAFDGDFNVYAAGTLFGGITDSLGDHYTWYSTLQDIETYFGLTTCKTNACERGHYR